MSQVDNLFKQTLIPMASSRVKLFEANYLDALTDSINDWVISTKSVILGLSPVSKLQDVFAVWVIYMEATDATS